MGRVPSIRWEGPELKTSVVGCTAHISESVHLDSPLAGESGQSLSRVNRLNNGVQIEDLHEAGTERDHAHCVG